MKKFPCHPMLIHSTGHVLGQTDWATGAQLEARRKEGKQNHNMACMLSAGGQAAPETTLQKVDHLEAAVLQLATQIMQSVALIKGTFDDNSDGDGNGTGGGDNNESNGAAGLDFNQVRAAARQAKVARRQNRAQGNQRQACNLFRPSKKERVKPHVSGRLVRSFSLFTAADVLTKF